MGYLILKALILKSMRLVVAVLPQKTQSIGVTGVSKDFNFVHSM